MFAELDIAETPIHPEHLGNRVDTRRWRGEKLIGERYVKQSVDDRRLARALRRVQSKRRRQAWRNLLCKENVTSAP